MGEQQTDTALELVVAPDTEYEPRLMVAIMPERTGVPNSDIFFDFIEMATRAAIDGFGIMRASPAHVAMARNRAAQHFLESDPMYTHLLMLDADHRHPPTLPLHMAKRFKASPAKKVISALVFRRGRPFDPCHYIADEDGIIYTIANWSPGLIKIDVSGTAALCVAREVFETIPEPWFYFDWGGANAGNYPGEDTYFSRMCHDYGIDMWVDTTICSPHMDYQYIDTDTFKSYLAMKQSEQIGELIHDESEGT